MAREAKLMGFVLLLIAIFAAAQLTGAHLGPLSVSHPRVSSPAAPGGGMNMGPGR